MTDFDALVSAWKKDTENLSSVIKIVSHPAYKKIIEMGEKALPLILNELKKETDYWFNALIMISGDNPVPYNDAGYMDRMKEHWLEWGKKKGLC
jgi:hypothetical protein